MQRRPMPVQVPRRAPTVRKIAPRLFQFAIASLAFAQPAAALNADYWRGGWRTPLGDESHIYEFVIRGNRVSGVYCRNCSDATTIGFIDGKWDEKAGITFTVTFANPAGRITSVDDQHAMLADGRLIVTGAANIRNSRTLTLIKDPRGVGDRLRGVVVQNEMLAGILGNGVVIDPAKPPARPARRGGFTLVGPMSPVSTRGNSSE